MRVLIKITEPYRKNKNGSIYLRHPSFDIVQRDQIYTPQNTSTLTHCHHNNRAL